MRISQYKISLGLCLIQAKECNGGICCIYADPYHCCGDCDIKCDSGHMDLSEEIELYKKALKKANRRK